MGEGNSIQWQPIRIGQVVEGTASNFSFLVIDVERFGTLSHGELNCDDFYTPPHGRYRFGSTASRLHIMMV